MDPPGSTNVGLPPIFQVFGKAISSASLLILIILNLSAPHPLLSQNKPYACQYRFTFRRNLHAAGRQNKKEKEKWADCTICTSLPRWYLK